MKLLRQGDVLLVRCRRKPSCDAKIVTDRGRVILAYGEQTGHAHQVCEATTLTDPDPVPPCQLFEEPDGTRLLVVKRPSALRHEEHDPLALDAGSTWEIRRQAEWSLDQIRQVAD